MLPREGVVVVALGPFKALLHTEACLLFEAGKIDVSHVVPVLAELMQANAEVSRHFPPERVSCMLEGHQQCFARIAPSRANPGRGRRMKFATVSRCSHLLNEVARCTAGLMCRRYRGFLRSNWYCTAVATVSI